MDHRLRSKSRSKRNLNPKEPNSLLTLATKLYKPSLAMHDDINLLPSEENFFEAFDKRAFPQDSPPDDGYPQT